MRAQSFLLEPPPTAEAGLPAVQGASVPLDVAVVGMRRGSGASTVAGGLAAALALYGARSAHLITPDGDPSAVSRLGGAPAAIVWDVPPSGLDGAALPRARIDVTVLVASGGGEPALAAVAAELLEARHRGRVLVAANRVRDPRRWSDHAAVCLPESRLAALLAARGRLPPGELGIALGRLAALLDDGRSPAKRDSPGYVVPVG